MVFPACEHELELLARVAVNNRILLVDIQFLFYGVPALNLAFNF